MIISFWKLLRACQPDLGGMFDEAINRALEIELELPKGSVEWVRLAWPGIEFYLYDNPADGEPFRREGIQGDGDVVGFTRPQGVDCDWLVRMEES